VADGGAADATHTVSAATPEGATTVVRVRRVAELGSGLLADPMPTLEEPPAPSADGTPVAELSAAIELVRRLPHARGTLRRLAWTFFRAPSPRHVRSERAHLDAVARFGEWAYFSARPGGGRTLAEQAIEAARASLGDANADALLERTSPRFSIYRVATPGPQHLMVDDVLRRETVRLATFGKLVTLSPGDQFVGNLYPCGDGDWTIRSTVARIEGTFDGEALEPETATAGSAVELGLFGASHDWLDELDTVGDLRAAWHRFREDLASGGLALPTFATLQQRIREAESPQWFRAELTTQQWWSADEAEVCLHFLDRAWQLTPRDELAGRSPHAVLKAARRRGRRRAKKKRARRA
jgi:hypothetical protein